MIDKTIANDEINLMNELAKKYGFILLPGNTCYNDYDIEIELKARTNNKTQLIMELKKVFSTINDIKILERLDFKKRDSIV